MTVPTQGESFSILIEHLRKAQEASAILAHLANANDSRVMAAGWLTVSEGLKQMQHKVTQFAMGKLQ